VYTHNDSKYDGEWKNDELDGQGLFSTPEGTWEGTFNKGHPETCYVHYANGDSYEGTWKGWSRHGRGLYKFANGLQYYGDFQNHCAHGLGVHFRETEDGAVVEFRGNFRKDLKEGKGIQYVPEWRVGTFSGDVFEETQMVLSSLGGVRARDATNQEVKASTVELLKVLSTMYPKLFLGFPAGIPSTNNNNNNALDFRDARREIEPMSNTSAQPTIAVSKKRPRPGLLLLCSDSMLIYRNLCR
jgi:hypothetical protein